MSIVLCRTKLRNHTSLKHISFWNEFKKKNFILKLFALYFLIIYYNTIKKWLTKKKILCTGVHRELVVSDGMIKTGMSNTKYKMCQNI